MLLIRKTGGPACPCRRPLKKIDRQFTEEMIRIMADLLHARSLSIGVGHLALTDQVDLTIRKGEITGLVGESGCGKSVTAMSFLGMLPQPGGRLISGSVEFSGHDIYKMPAEDLRKLRGSEISMIFQEPSTALNPLYKIGKQLKEVFDYHEYDGDQDERIQYLMKRVGFSDTERVLNSYPHQLSGGMLQRVVIALALMLEPALIIADEPTTALDVTVQAQIMELLVELQKEEHCSVLLITHNLGLVAQYADRVAVMYAGRIAEERDTESFLQQPWHPYSKGLLAALPDLAEKKELNAIPGTVPSPADFSEGCRFADRCEKRFEPCSKKPDDRFPESDSQRVACFLYTNKNESEGAMK